MDWLDFFMMSFFGACLLYFVLQATIYRGVAAGIELAERRKQSSVKP